MANGTRMSTITALLLQLIQASALGTAARVRRLRKSAGDAEAERPAEGKEDLVTAVSLVHCFVGMSADEQEKRICAESTESCFRSASAVAGYLLQRCGQSKASKSTLDADFKTILDSFITDLLKSLYEPEWPAAALYLSVFGKMFIAALEDVSVTVESTTIKNIALDHLGTIGAKLKAVAVEGREGSGDIMSLDQVGHTPFLLRLARRKAADPARLSPLQTCPHRTLSFERRATFTPTLHRPAAMTACLLLLAISPWSHGPLSCTVLSTRLPRSFPSWRLKRRTRLPPRRNGWRACCLGFGTH